MGEWRTADRIPDTAPAKQSDVVQVVVPGGADATVLQLRDSEPLLRLPACLAPSNLERPLPGALEMEKQRIAQQFFRAVSAARAASPDQAEVVAEWKAAQRVADDEYRRLVGAAVFRQQVEALNPEIDERATALRREQQTLLVEETKLRRPSETSETAGQPVEPLNRQVDATTWRKEQQQRLLEARQARTSPAPSR
jgi:hypothetical protein